MKLHRAVVAFLGLASLALASPPIIKPGVYEGNRPMEDFSALQITIFENDGFVATFVWHDDVSFSIKEGIHTEKIKGTIAHPNEDELALVVEKKFRRWPLGEVFKIVSESEIRCAHEYPRRDPDGQWRVHPQDTVYLILKKQEPKQPAEPASGHGS